MSRGSVGSTSRVPPARWWGIRWDHRREGAPGAPLALARVEDEDGLLRGFRIDGAAPDVECGLDHLERLRSLPIVDRAEFNLVKVDGLCHIIRSLWEHDDLNGAYRYRDAMGDALMSQLGRTVPWAPDPASLVGSSLVDTLGRVRPKPWTPSRN